MKPFKKILVPVDFSPHSDAAIVAAADLAKHYGAQLTLANVYGITTYALPEGYTLITPSQLSDLLTSIGHLLDKAKAEALRLGASEVTTQQLQGVPATEIVEHAKQGEYDLIVMGTHGRTGLKHALLGSVAERVLRLAPCAVLTVKVS
jgi:nucleotide-binding universal stress UspA family protein